MEELPTQVSQQESERKRAVSEAMTVSVTPEEYAERRGDFPDPYEEIIRMGDIEVVCFGASHQNNPNDPQMDRIKDLIEKHRPELLLVEGMRILEEEDNRDDFREYLRSITYEEAAKSGEAFMTTWFAVKNDIRTVSPEPSYERLFKELGEAGHDKRAILLEKLLSLTVQWKTHNVQEPIDTYVEPRRNKWAEMLGLSAKGILVEQCEQYSRELDIPLSRTNILEDRLVFSLQDPIPWKGKTMYATNFVAQESSKIRDRMILERIYDEIKRGANNLMVVYGASHIHMQAPAIRKLLESVD